jgi:hypothetical protein
MPDSTVFSAKAKALNPGEDALRVDLSFHQGHVNGIIFQGDVLEIKLGGLLVLRATNYTINTIAPADRFGSPIDSVAPLASFESASVDVTIGSMTLGGEARNFWIAYVDFSG